MDGCVHKRVDVTKELTIQIKTFGKAMIKIYYKILEEIQDLFLN